MITKLSGLTPLEIQDAPEPTVKSGQTIVRVKTGGLNFADVMTTKGGYPGTPPAPLVAGREFCGMEESSGRVMGYAQWGAFAEKVAAYSNMLWPVPDPAWSDEQASRRVPRQLLHCIPRILAGRNDAASDCRTHASCSDSCGSWRSGNGGGADRQTARRRYVRDVVVGRKARARGRRWASDTESTTSNTTMKQVVKNLTHGEGVDAVFEMLGGEHTAKSLRCLRDFGRVIQYLEPRPARRREAGSACNVREVGHGAGLVADVSIAEAGDHGSGMEAAFGMDCRGQAHAAGRIRCSRWRARSSCTTAARGREELREDCAQDCVRRWH